jgi:hypothetical protein
MSHSLPSPLPPFDRWLLRSVMRLVPVAEREEWCRTWEAELWHMRYSSRRRPAIALVSDLSIGLTRDALWLRTNSWTRTFSGTPTLCLAILMSLCILSVAIAVLVTDSWRPLSLYFASQLKRSLIGAPLVVFVTFATASRRHLKDGPVNRKLDQRLFWIKRQFFFVAKSALVLLLAFMLSADLYHPMHATLPNTADILQILSYVLIAIGGMRWAFHDQELRCKQCLHSLATPARVGRPSHNLLEWNGTKLACKQGHGLLSIPEIETSWCQASRWTHQLLP